MQFYQSHKALAVLLLVGLAILLFVVIEILIILFNGKPVPVPEIERGKQTIGNGPPLTYAILGDSTAVGQGGDYSKGIALSTAQTIAAKHTVTFQNFAVSGAKSVDVLRNQVGPAAELKPDIVLISTGANDVTHLTTIKNIEKNMMAIIARLKEANPDVKIILTGAPQMGSVPRFPQPVKHFAKVRTAQVNTVFTKLAEKENVTLAPIAKKTGPIFTKNPQLFAVDKFHPNNEGYAEWVPILNKALASALQSRNNP